MTSSGRIWINAMNTILPLPYKDTGLLHLSTREVWKNQYRFHIRTWTRPSPAAGAHLDLHLWTTRDKKRCEWEIKTCLLNEKNKADVHISCHFGIKCECDWMQIVGFAVETRTPGPAGVWDGIRRCARLRRLRLCESTWAPRYLLPISGSTAAATLPCCLDSSHIRSKRIKMVSRSEWKYAGWTGIALRAVCARSHASQDI